MAEVGNLVAKVSMDQTGFQQGISALNRQMKVVQSEFKAASAGLGDFGKSTEGLKLKADSLTRQLDIQRQRVQALEAAHQKSVESKGADAKATQNLEVRLNNAKAYMSNLEGELKKTTAEIEKQASVWTKISKSCEEAGRKFQDVGKKLTDVGKSMSLKVTAPIMGIGAAAVKIGMDFEESMSKVKAMSGATGEEMGQLEKAARDAGASTSKSAKEAADALGYMALAGWDVQTSMKGLMPVLRLSEAGNIDLARASSLVTDSMSAMGIKVQDLQGYLDIVAQTARSSNTDIDQMAQAYLGVGGTLRGLNVPLEESALALGFLANAGVKGSEAGNALNAVLINLTAPTARAKKALEGLNFSAFDSQGKFKGLENVLFELKDKLAGMTEEQKNMALAMIGGKEHVKDLNALLNGLENGYDDLKASIAGADGALEDVAQTMRDNAKGSLIELKSALEEVALKIYDVLRPVVASLIESLKKFVAWLNNLSPEMQRTIVIVAGLAAAIGPLLVAAGAMSRGLDSVLKACSRLVAFIPKLASSIIWLATNPIGQIILAIGALVTAGVLIYKNWDKIKYYGLQAWGSLKAGVLKAIDAIAGAYEKLLGWVPILGDKIRDAHAKVRAAIEAEQDILNARVRPGTKSDADIAKGFRAMEQESKGAAAGVKSATEDISGALDGIIPSFDNVGSATSTFGSKTKAAAEKVKTAWTGTVESIKSALSTLRTQHETEMTYAEMAGDKIETLRLKHRQLSSELEAQKAVVAATRGEIEKATVAGAQEGETTEDLAKRIDELNKKLADEEKAQAGLEKQIQDTSEAIKAQGKSAKNLADELKKVADTYNTDMAKALDEYQKKVKDTNDSLRKDTEALQRDLSARLADIAAKGADRERQVTESFQRELENRTRALMNFVGLFDEITRKEVSGEKLLQNLEGQVDAFDDWQEDIAKLAERGIDKGLLQELREMGAKAAPEIKALNTLTDEQLTQYANLWKQKQEQARKEAATQLAQQRNEMNQQLSDIRADTANQMEQQRQEVARKMEEMTAKAKEELAKYKLEWEKKNEEIRANTEKNIKDIHDKFNDLVGKSTSYGVALIDNFMDGIDSRMPALISQLENMASIIDSYMPHSPAKRGPLKKIAEWGPSIIGELVEGIKRSLPRLDDIGLRMAMLSPGALQPAIANVSNMTTANNYGGNVFHIHVTGSGAREQAEDLMRELAKRGVRF